MKGAFFDEWEHTHTVADVSERLMPDMPGGFSWQLVSVVATEVPVVEERNQVRSRKVVIAYWKRPVTASGD